jgi:streptomycin 6-kinase
VPAVTVPERLALSARALGEAGEAWLAALPGLLADLEADWSVTVGTGLEGGNAAYVAEAVTSDGTPAVLKVPVPPVIDGFTPFERQLAALQLAGGDPYAGLIRYDVPRRALLLERLGRPMASLGWPASRQAGALARTAARGWRQVPDDGRLPSGAEAARWLSGFISSAWEDLARPCPEAVVDLAVRCADAREAAFDPGRAVLVHGDVHAFNALQVPGPVGAGAGFRLVDAEGLISEPAHDLGVILVRGVPGWIGDLAGGDPQQVLVIVARRCRHAGRLAGADPDAVWQWAFTELVSTGLFLLRLGQHGEAETFLAVAGKLAAATANGQPDRVRQDPGSGQADGPARHTTGK